MLNQKGGFSQCLEGCSAGSGKPRGFGVFLLAPHWLPDGLWGISAWCAGLHKQCSDSLLQRDGVAGCVLAHLQIRD